MVKLMKTIEQIAFENLKKTYPDLVKNNLKKTTRDAMEWVGGPNDYFDLEWSSPGFIPDATRQRNHLLQRDVDGEKHYERIAVVEIWEIEDTSKITSRKMQVIQDWWFREFDPRDYPFFELWTTDRWGNNRNMIWADWRDVYDWKSSDLIAYSKELEECTV